MKLNDSQIKEILNAIILSPRFFDVLVTTISEYLENAHKQESDHTQEKNKRRGRVTNWSKSSDTSLKLAYHRRKRMARPIEPELHAEMVKRFSNYDATTQTLHRKAHVCSPHSLQVTDFTQKTNRQIYKLFFHRKKKKQPIEPELQAELIKRFPNYDGKQQKFIRSKKHKKTVTNWAQKSDRALRRAYSILTKKSQSIPEDLHNELSRRIPEYDVTTRTMTTKNTTIQTSTQTTKKSIQTADTRSTMSTPATISVTLKKIKRSKTGVFYDVFLNDKRVLHNHANTRLKTFADGTLLAIRGIVTDNLELPQKPIWLLFDTDMTATKWTGTEKFSGHQVYIKTILPNTDNDTLHIELSNRCIQLLNIERAIKRANGTRFQIIK